jgi:protein LTV1
MNHTYIYLYLKAQKKIRVSGRTGIPLGVLDGSNGGGTKLTAHALARHNISNEENHCDCDGTESMVSTLSLLSVRPSDETPEERYQRKRALRQYRRVCGLTLNLV